MLVKWLIGKLVSWLVGKLGGWLLLHVFLAANNVEIRDKPKKLQRSDGTHLEMQSLTS